LNLVELVTGIDGATAIPDAVWYCPSLTPTDVKLYKVLLDFGGTSSRTTKEGFPIISVSQMTLAEIVGVSVRTLQGCLGRLKSVKLIRVEGNKGFRHNNEIILTGEFFGVKSVKEGRLYVVEKQIKRVPVKRVPIKIDKAPSYTEKLRELGGFTYTEKAVVAISRHYDMLVSRFNHTSGYRSLPRKDPQQHKNWKQFLKLYNLCKEKGWDVNLYLDAQFDRAKKWWKDSKIKYPMPNMLCSEKSIVYFERFLEDRQQKYEHDVTGKNTLKGQKTVSMKQKLIEDVVRSAQYLSMYIREDDDPNGRAEDKAVRLFHSWESYSAAYLYSIPWFREYLKELEKVQPDNKRVREVLETFAMIDRSSKLKELIRKAVEMAEKQFGIPGNIAI
jgi:hypothetical protein